MIVGGGVLGPFNRWSHRRFRDLLSPYIDRRLDKPQMATLEEHLATCGPCQKELQTLTATVSLLQALPHATPRRSFTLMERPEVSRAAPAYLWGMRAATAMASVALVLLLAGDILGTFSRDVAPTGEVGQGAVERGGTDAGTPVTEKDAEAAPQTLASEADAPQAESAALLDSSPHEARAEREESVPVTALEVALGSLLALLAIVTLFATWRFRRSRQLA
jgi:anti-sigma factor RsiW